MYRGSGGDLITAHNATTGLTRDSSYAILDPNRYEEQYKVLDADKWVATEGWGNPETTHGEILESLKRYEHQDQGILTQDMDLKKSA